MYSQDITTITSNIIENLDKKIELENIMLNEEDYYEFKNYYDDYIALYHVGYTNEFFKSSSNLGYVTYLDYLMDKDIDLHNAIINSTIKEDHKDALSLFGLIADDIKETINSDRLIYNNLFQEYLVNYIFYMIDYFKSYTIQLEDFNIIFTLNNKFENSIILKDHRDVLLNYLQADLLNLALSDDDSFKTSLFDLKDTVKVSLNDSFNLTLLT
jgi:hypothetical protein